MTPDRLTTLAGKYSPRQTMDRLVSAVERRGMGVFARIDHAAAAAGAGLALRPTEVLLFGNPKVGTLLMQDVQTLGIELPLKVLVWQGADGGTRLSYFAPEVLASRHHAGAAVATALQAMSQAIEAVAREAAGEGAA